LITSGRNGHDYWQGQRIGGKIIRNSYLKTNRKFVKSASPACFWFFCKMKHFAQNRPQVWDTETWKCVYMYGINIYIYIYSCRIFSDISRKSCRRERFFKTIYRLNMYIYSCRIFSDISRKSCHRVGFFLSQMRRSRTIRKSTESDYKMTTYICILISYQWQILSSIISIGNDVTRAVYQSVNQSNILSQLLPESVSKSIFVQIRTPFLNV